MLNERQINKENIRQEPDVMIQYPILRHARFVYILNEIPLFSFSDFGFKQLSLGI